MGSGKWGAKQFKIQNSKFKIQNWGVGNGNGEWIKQFAITNYQLPISNYQLAITN
ncbi:MAG: hypothetical protein KME64_04270 [Scytonematopsis contorta HA4267-MV1]|jgi:hypothetical protein|nr:hypothetical protein [Scytonematopsis contorta HA4267-MV1]